MVSIGYFSLPEFIFCLLSAIYLFSIVCSFVYVYLIHGLRKSMQLTLYVFGIPIGVIQCIRSVDMQGFHGVFSVGLVTLMADNVTMLLMFCVTYVIHNFMTSTLYMLHQLDIESTKLRQRFSRISYICISLNLFMVLALNTVDTYLIFYPKVLIRSILFLTLSIDFIITCICVQFACGYLRTTLIRFKRMLIHKPNIGSILAQNTSSMFDMPSHTSTTVTDMSTPLLHSLFALDAASKNMAISRKQDKPPQNTQNTENVSISIPKYTTAMLPMNNSKPSSVISNESPRHTLIQTPTPNMMTPTAISIAHMVLPDEASDELQRFPSSHDLILPELHYQDVYNETSEYTIQHEENVNKQYIIQEEHLKKQTESQEQDIQKTLQSLAELRQYLFYFRGITLLIFSIAIFFTSFSAVNLYLENQTLKPTRDFLKDDMLTYVQLVATYILLGVLVVLYKMTARNLAKN